jgi:hypothetical protein
MQGLGTAWRLAAVLDADADIDIDIEMTARAGFDMQIPDLRN